MRWLLYVSVALTVFTVFATVFAVSAEASRVRALPKWAWVLLCLLITPIGGILYLAFGRPVQGAASEQSQQRFSPSSAPRPYGRAPEDDPAFMRELERRLREQKGSSDDV